MKRIPRCLTIAMLFAILTACATHTKPILQPPGTMLGTAWTKEQIQQMAGSAAASNFYGATSRAGGASGSLDSIDGANLADGDASYAVQDGVFSVYRLNATSGAAEDDPDVISPDTNAGNKRWILVFQGDPKTAAISQLIPTDSNLIVGNGSTWVAESGNTARTSLGLGTGDSPDFTAITESSNAVPNATDGLDFFAATTSAELLGVLSDETGTGAAVFANTPTLVTPILGTPTSGTLTNATGLPISTGVSGLGSNVATFLVTPTSANLASAVTGETGSGAAMFNTAPSIADGSYLKTDEVRAYDSAGLKLYEDGGAGIFVQDSTGNVGIGTTSPGYPLEVSKALNSNWLAYFNNSGTSNAHGLLLDIGASSTGTPLLIRKGTTGLFTINNSGNVGIGTISPGYELEVAGDIYASGDVSALTFTDRTPFFEGDALAAIKLIKGVDGHIDHASLPAFAQRPIQQFKKEVVLGERVPVAEKDAWEDEVITETVQVKDAKGALVVKETETIYKAADGKITHETHPVYQTEDRQIIKKRLKEGIKFDEKTGEFYTQTSTVEKTVIAEEPGRDLGAMISILTKALQQLTARFEAHESEDLTAIK